METSQTTDYTTLHIYAEGDPQPPGGCHSDSALSRSTIAL
jgi:hypothetical protein